tara:strand:- start:11833 stop:12030 length:198 start_codon:yes stop_codon:yes gene_type:complete
MGQTVVAPPEDEEADEENHVTRWGTTMKWKEQLKMGGVITSVSAPALIGKPRYSPKKKEEEEDDE